MIVSHQPAVHLAYCQNIHPGETWPENYRNIADKAAGVRRTVAQPSDWFGLGLRLSAAAAAQLEDVNEIARGLDLFAEHQMYPFTINGFPFGKFHQTRVKENVYAPDWRTRERLDYTNRLATILQYWLPEGIDGSISTVPGSFGPWIKSPDAIREMAENLGDSVAHLANIQRETGKRIHLGLEPEPDCFLETTRQTLDFFRNDLPSGALPRITNALGVSASEAESLLRNHLGVCFDTCHIALQYEDLSESLKSLRTADILISKIQLSAAIRCGADDRSLLALSRFAEGTYLHQVKGRGPSGIKVSWFDLPEALEEAREPDCDELEELRVHFHVPLFLAPESPLQSTATALDPSFWGLVKEGITSHLEIETYTFDVLPKDLQPNQVEESIASEYRWTLANLGVNGPTS